MKKKLQVKKEIGIGFLVGLIATLFGCFVFIEFFLDTSFEESLTIMKEQGLRGKVLVIGAIANFFVFFTFIKKKQLYRARGVLMETFVVAFIVLLLTIFSE